MKQYIQSIPIGNWWLLGIIVISIIILIINKKFWETDKKWLKIFTWLICAIFSLLIALVLFRWDFFHNWANWTILVLVVVFLLLMARDNKMRNDMDALLPLGIVVCFLILYSALIYPIEQAFTS